MRNKSVKCLHSCWYAQKWSWMRDPHILSFKIFTLLRLPFASALFSNPTFPVVICCFFCYLSFISKHELFLRPIIYHTVESWVFEQNLSPPPPSSIFFRRVFALSFPLTRHAASFSIVDNQNNDRLDFVPVSDKSKATNNRQKISCTGNFKVMPFGMYVTTFHRFANFYHSIKVCEASYPTLAASDRLQSQMVAWWRTFNFNSRSLVETAKL